MLIRGQDISPFCGITEKKDHVTYERWKYEVQYLQEIHTCTEDEKVLAIRQSLRGDAAGIARRLGHYADIGVLLNKMYSVYGVVESRESLLETFYAAVQRDDEDVSAWSCRLEKIMSNAVQKGEIQLGNTSEMLRSKLWKGVKPSLRDISGHTYDNMLDYDALLIAIRQLEHAHGKTMPRHLLCLRWLPQ